MNDEAQNVPDNEKASDETPLTSASTQPSAETDLVAVELASNGISAEPTLDVAPVTSDLSQDPELEALLPESAHSQSDSVTAEAISDDSVALGETQDAPAIEVSAVADEAVPELSAEVSMTRTEIEDPRAVAQTIAPEATDEPVEPVAEPAQVEAVADSEPTAVEVTAETFEVVPPAVTEPVSVEEDSVDETSAEPIRTESSEPAIEVESESTDAVDSEPATEVSTKTSTEVVDDNFILEKVAEAKAAKKKKVATPRVRKPPKRGKQKLPDLGDGSGYEPPDTAGAVVVENADGSQSTTEVEEEALWYAVHCYSGYENKVKHSLEQRIETMGMAGRILEVVVPTEEEIEVRDGKRKTVERRVFPGYVLVRMRMSEDSWHVVRNTPGVTRFIGMGNRPQPLSPQEVNQILRRMEAEAPKIKVSFKVGQKVRITDGPFADFMGMVDKIDTERAKVAVLVSFFGRETPVELDFLQVEKM